MEANYFAILRLRPGRYSPNIIDSQYRSVREEILHAGGSDAQRRLDDALIAHSLLRDPNRQAAFAERITRNIVAQPIRRPTAVRRVSPQGRANNSAAAPQMGTTVRLTMGRAPKRAAPQRHASSARPMATPMPRITRPAELAPAPASEDTYARFARMVTDHVEAGLLRFTARQRLMMLAQGMEIGEFKANLIIAEVLHDIRLGQSNPGRGVSGPYLKPARSDDASGFGTPLMIAIILASLADLALFAWLLK